MKKIFFALVVAIACLISATATIDPSTRLRIKADRHSAPRAKIPYVIADTVGADTLGEDTVPKPPYYPLLIQISGDSIVDSLLSMGSIIYNRRADILLTSILRDSLDRALALDGVKNAAMADAASLDMDSARIFCNVDPAHQGQQGLPMSYDGSGVVVGFSDIGFDPNHIAFFGRVKTVYNCNPLYGEVQKAATAEEIKQWSTDDADNYHATHVANILAGGYRGNPYYGVASGADIVGTTSSLHDVGILAGVEEVIAYAKEHGQPAVINLSLSSHLGAHDGSGLLNLYLAECAKDAIICISAGNKGKTNIYGSADLNAYDAEARVFVNNLPQQNGIDVYGITDFWSEDTTSFALRFEIYDLDTKESLFVSPWMGDTVVTDSLSFELTDSIESAPYLQGRWYAECGISELNNRFCASVLYDTHCEQSSDRGTFGKYYTVLAIKHKYNPCHVDIFSDGAQSYLSVTGDKSVRVSTDCSINDMCTSDGVIAVGNCVSRTTYPVLGDSFSQLGGYTVGSISPYSSYSDIPTVASLPHFSAPGTMVVSATSTPFYKNYPEFQVSAMAEMYGKKYYWHPAMGTSMSSPFTAGVVALWLQANPCLTPQEIIDIATSTASNDYSDIDNPRWGAGSIDALAGLKKVVADAGIISAEVVPLIIVTADGRIEAVMPECDASSQLRVYTLSGMQVDASQPLAKGIYVATVGSYARKVIVR